MSKLKNAMAALVAFVFVVAPAFAEGDAGCKTGKFIGSYTQAQLFADLWGDGSGIDHVLVRQFNLHSDGTVYGGFTGFPELLLSGGTGTPLVGSWVCRSDGKLVMTFITSAYGPTTDAINHPTTVPDPPPVDLLLSFHFRTTVLFSIKDENTLTRIQARTRRYAPTQDPTDPASGTLLPLNTTAVVFKRLVASDADLLLP